MASREELNNKRQQARKLHKAATRKVSRLKSKGVDVAKSGIDPRRDLSTLKRLNTKQLDSYIKRLEAFNSRSTQFAPGKGGEALPGDKWWEVATKVKQVNRKREALWDEIKDLRIPSMGNVSLAEDQAMRTPDHPTMGATQSRAPHLPVRKDSQGIAKAKLNQNIAELNAKLDPAYERKVLSGQRWAAYRMLDDIGRTDMVMDLVKMSDKAFNVLWNYTHFAEAEVLYYHRMQGRNHDRQVIADQDSVIDDQFSKMKSMIQDVKNLNL